MADLAARVLAQVVQDGPVTITGIAAALALDPHAEVRPELERHQRAGRIRTVLVYGRAPVPLNRYEATDAGRIEASGGAQLSLVRRPPVAAQPSLF